MKQSIDPALERELKIKIWQPDLEIKFTKQDILDCIADFTYFWGADFFVETPFGNFHWKDPDYNGDNSFTLINQDCGQFCKSMNVEFGRSKGFHNLEFYCGPDINIVAPERLKPT